MNNTSTYRKTLPELLIRLGAVVLPLCVVSFITLSFISLAVTSFNTGIVQQTIYFSSGLITAYILYFFRLRFLFTAVFLIAGYYIADAIISGLPGEFDVFYAVVRFRLFSWLFGIGWLFGFLLVRVKYSWIGISALLLLATMISVSDTTDLSVSYMISHLLPVTMYTLYMLFVMPGLDHALNSGGKSVLRLLIRVAAFLLTVAVLFFISGLYFKSELNSVEKELQSRGKDNKEDGDLQKGYDERNGMLERGDKENEKDGGGYRMKDTLKLQDKSSQSDQLMFCSKLDNYFPDGSPKPVYYAYHYLTKYDPQKEQFMRDPDMPLYDEFNVDPSEIPIYRTRTDSNVIRNSYASKKRKIIEAEVYITTKTWKHALLAPSGAFFCQSIPVDSAYKKIFTSAYRIKSYVSELNNAYFVYNPSGNPMLEEYQQERYDELRTVKDYKSIDTAFYKYYTTVPASALFDSIHSLSQKITRGASTPIDKIIAVRDFFMQRDADGKKIFRYTLTPGKNTDPNIPSASMLKRFLFENHSGYCTYFAGASVFLLRSAGIPCRFTTGFATIDRSDKNKGWYWFYGSQAHAWIQVYFPEYGWLDFDMTISNDDMRESPQPDGTPPIPPPQPWLVAEGIVTSAPDPDSKTFDFEFDRLTFHNEDFRTSKIFTRKVNAAVCRILYGKRDTSFQALHKGDTIVLVSYDDAAKEVPDLSKSIHIDLQVEKFPETLIADEIHIRKSLPEEKRDTEKDQKKNAEETWTWLKVLKIVMIAALVLLALAWSVPVIWLMFLLIIYALAKTAVKKADALYRLSLYVFHMNGVEYNTSTALEYAIQKADPYFNADLEKFIRIYLKLKYSGQNATSAEEEYIIHYRKNFMKIIQKKSGRISYILSFLNVFRAHRYFRKKTSSDLS